MPPRNKIKSLLPEAIEKELNTKLIANSFSDYNGLENWLVDKGFAISRSAIHRHGQKLEKRLQQVKDATEGARLMAEAVNDDANLLSGAVISMLQSELFNVMVSLQELDENTSLPDRAKLLKDLTNSIRGCGLVSLDQKEFERLYKERAEKDAVAQMEKTAKSAKALGVSDEAINRIRSEVLGFDSAQPTPVG